METELCLSRNPRQRVGQGCGRVQLRYIGEASDVLWNIRRAREEEGGTRAVLGFTCRMTRQY